MKHISFFRIFVIAVIIIESKKMKTQYITNNLGKKVAVIVPVKDYEKLLDELEELACIKAYDKVKAGKREFITAVEMFTVIEQKRKPV